MQQHFLLNSDCLLAITVQTTEKMMQSNKLSRIIPVVLEASSPLLLPTPQQAARGSSAPGRKIQTAHLLQSKTLSILCSLTRKSNPSYKTVNTQNTVTVI